ncbi:hypothetical protein ABBQ32_005521 [Trebouxia sp. C0010 RCD-2024]
MHFSCPCKPDQAVWPEASCSVRSHQACIRHKFCLSSQPRRMRRAPSLNILRSKVATEGKAGNKDTALSTDDKLRPQLSNSLQTKTEMQKSSFTVFGLQPSPELLSISMVYFVQGILGLARLAISFFYKDEFHLDPATVAIVTGLGAAPWVVKPVYGFLSDTVPIFGYRRRSYLIICGLLGTVSWTALATIVSTPSMAVAMVVLGSLGTACSDVVVDSIVVERSRGEPQSTAGSLQSLCWASSAVGGIASAYFSGSLVEAYGPRGVFGLTALFPLIVSLSAVFISEQPVVRSGSHKRDRPSEDNADAAESGRLLAADLLAPPEFMMKRLYSQAHALWGAVQQRSIFLPAIFVFLWQATPSADTAMFFFQTNHLHFSAEFLGRVRLVGSMASLAGVATYNYLLKDVPLTKMFFWTAVLGTALGMTQLILITGTNQRWGLSNELFVLGDSLILTVLGQVSFMPVLVLAARLCPEGVEATLFATLMSVLNGGAFAGSTFGALLTKSFGVTSEDFTNLAPLVTVCTLSSLLPLPLLKMLPQGSTTEQIRNNSEK